MRFGELRRKDQQWVVRHHPAGRRRASVVVEGSMRVQWWFLPRRQRRDPTTSASGGSGHACHPPVTNCRGGSRSEAGSGCLSGSRLAETAVQSIAVPALRAMRSCVAQFERSPNTLPPANGDRASTRRRRQQCRRGREGRSCGRAAGEPATPKSWRECSRCAVEHCAVPMEGKAVSIPRCENCASCQGVGERAPAQPGLWHLGSILWVSPSRDRSKKAESKI